MMLGAVLAGGAGLRFGGDKALADLGGRTLLDIAIEALRQWCDTVIVVGRIEAPVRSVPDWPAPGMGPLGGIAAALRLAAAEGFDTVLTCGVDSVGLPADLPDRLGPAPACLATQPVVGIWPVSAAETVSAMLEGDGRHSLLAFARRAGARELTLANGPANINTRADLSARQGDDAP
jgi:molybdopterin-guanine dinucleotide biosynthesis protein A